MARIYDTRSRNYLEGTGNPDELYGLDGNDVMYGFGGNDRLYGGIGADLMFGGYGNDIYYVDNVNDVASENLGEGSDTVFSTVSYTLTANVEGLFLEEGAGAINGTGNSGDNVIFGTSSANILTGGGSTTTLSLNGGFDTLAGFGGADTLRGDGVDHMYGGTENDTYYVNKTGDRVFENANEGYDRVFSSISLTLAANVERLTLQGTAATGTGNGLDNRIEGNNRANTIDGRGGADIMAGRQNNDIYFVDNAGDQVLEALNEGADEVRTAVTINTLALNVENLVLLESGGDIDGSGNNLNNNILGNTYDNFLFGNDGNDTIDGGAGADRMFGGRHDDTYIVERIGDEVFEGLNEGNDTVHSYADFVLSPNVENLVLLNSSLDDTLDGTGNNLRNTIVGNSGDNVINGQGQGDVMMGGLGNDTYYVAEAGDIVFEWDEEEEGIDKVISSRDYQLGDSVENLELALTAITGSGNELDNHIIGNGSQNVLTGYDGEDTLDGRGGIDTMTGGRHDDTYIVDNRDDVVTELQNEGYDEVQSSAFRYRLAANVEKLTLLAGALEGSGNELANMIVGNASPNTLFGGSDTVADTLIGGGGDDTYSVDAGDIVIEENDPFGQDTVQARVDYTLGDHVENLALMNGSGAIDGRGNDLDNTLIGNNDANTLMGAGGYDEITGGRGNDRLIGGDGQGNQQADAFFFNLGDGSDTIEDFVAGVDFIGFNGHLTAFRFESFDELLGYMSQQGDNVVIAFDAQNQITLSNVALTSLSAQDFML